MAPPKSKPKRGKTQKAAATAPGGDAAPAETSAGEFAGVIKSLNAPSLSTPDLNHLLVHVANVVNVRSALENNTTLAAQDICYTQVGNSSTVTLWRDGHIVGSTTEDDAHARNIPACG